MGIQTLIQTIFPPECLNCSARVETPFAICGSCWSDTPFILGACCDACGKPLPGEPLPDDVFVCDACLKVPRPWAKGRAVMEYNGVGRSLVLALKHGDRPDIARAAGPWMARAGANLLEPGAIIVPIPLHWMRLVKRRFNQAALLSHAFAKETGLQVAPTALIRSRHTPSQDGKGVEGRFLNVENAIVPHPKLDWMLDDATVILVDDVMTSGATFTAATEALLSAGAKKVSVLTLARVAHDT